MTQVRTQLERSNEARQRLIHAAITLLAERGYTGTTLAEIGREAGLSRGLVTHHFGTKDACILAAVQEIQAGAAKAFTPMTGRRGLALIDHIVAVYLESARSGELNMRALYVVHADSISEAPGLREAIAGTNELFRATLRGCLRQAVEDGEVDPDTDRGQVALLIEGMLRGVCMQWFVDPAQMDAAGATRAAQRLVRAGLGAHRPASA
jgi:AcrR family transcriptional regulator